jgi:hypothetical protein
MLVVVGRQALGGDAHSHLTLALEPGLTTQPRRVAHVERSIQGVLLGFSRLAQQSQPLFDIHVAGRARALAAARAAQRRAGQPRRLEHGHPERDLDLQPLVNEAYAGHRLLVFRQADPVLLEMGFYPRRTGDAPRHRVHVLACNRGLDGTIHPPASPAVRGRIELVHE